MSEATGVGASVARFVALFGSASQPRDESRHDPAIGRPRARSRVKQNRRGCSLTENAPESHDKAIFQRWN